MVSLDETLTAGDKLWKIRGKRTQFTSF